MGEHERTMEMDTDKAADRSTDQLPEITLDHVEFGEETWDYGHLHGMMVQVPKGDEPLLRWAVQYPTYVVLVPPTIEEREVVIDVGDGSGRTVTETVFVTIDPGVRRELTTEELVAKKEEAKGKLVEWLRHVAAAYRYLVPEP